MWDLREFIFFLPVYLLWPSSLPFFTTPLWNMLFDLCHLLSLALNKSTEKKILWRTCEEDFQIHCTNNIYTNTHTCTHMLSFLFRSIRRWGELKYKDGRCSTSSENCNFCSPVSLGWQEIFHPRCHQRINKTSGAECSPSLSQSYTHTYTRARLQGCTHLEIECVYTCNCKMCTAVACMCKCKYTTVFMNTNTTRIFLLSHTPASAMKISCCI